MKALIRKPGVRWWAAALLVLLAASAAVGAFGLGPESGDIDVFSGYGRRIVEGAVPYRDVGLEYPPGALSAIVPPALGGPSEHGYALRFETAMVAVLAVTLAALAAERRRRALALVALAPLLLGPLVAERFDALPALLTLAALLLALRRRFGLSGLALGAGTAVKLYPLVLLPLLVAAAGRRSAAAAAGAFAAACAAVFVPFAVVAPHGIEESLRTQLGRHLQIETPLASVALLLHAAAGMNVGVQPEAHTYALGGTQGRLLAAVTSAALIVALAGIWVASIRLVRKDEGLVLAWAATLCAVAVLGRVLSPQYLLWLLPIVPLLRRRIGWAVTALLALGCVLTNIWYPGHYGDVVRRLDGGSIALLFVRNLVLAALLVILLVETARRARRPRDAAAPAARPDLPVRP